MKVPLLENDARLLLQSAALSAAANSIVLTDVSGTILWVNPAFSSLTGYASEEALGRNPRILKSGRHDAKFYRTFWKTLLAGDTWQGEFINRRKDGSLYIGDQTVTPVRSNGGQITHFIGVMQDATQRKEAEAQVRKLNEELEQRVRERTERLEAALKELDAFAYSVSHDLRAPLRHIRGFVDLLDDSAGQGLAEEDRHFLKQIQDSAGEMNQLIDDLLAFSRTSRLAMKEEPVDLQAVLEQALRQLRPDTKARRIAWKKSPLPKVLADPALLKQVLVNLLANALKYTRTRDLAEIEIGCASDTPDEVVLFVRDNGVGFDMTYADKLFGVFQRLHSREEFEGTGIGLASVRRIIARHGGRTWAEGIVDGGATFYFSLPRARQDGAR